MIKNLSDIVGKTYAARGAFTEIQIENSVPNGSIGFKAINNRKKCIFEGIIYNQSQYTEQDSLDYKVQFTKIKTRGHTTDLIKSRKKLVSKIKEADVINGNYEKSLKNKNITETYKGRIVNHIPVIDELIITIPELNKNEEQRDVEAEYDIHTTRNELQIGFKNILYNRHKGKILIIRPNVETYQQQHARKSVVVGVLDGEFVTEDLQDSSDESLIKITYLPAGTSFKTPHVRAGHVRHYEQPDGTIRLVAVAPYVVKPHDMPEDVKRKYYLNQHGEITQETMLLTEKRGSLEDRYIELLVDAFQIPKWEESYK